MKKFHIYYDGYACYEAETEEEALLKFENDSISPIEVNIEEIVEED